YAGDAFEDTYGCLAPVAARAGAVVRGAAAPLNPAFGDAPCEHETVHPVRIVDHVAADAPVSFARINHHPAALVDADVRDQGLPFVDRKKQQVPAPPLHTARTP